MSGSHRFMAWAAALLCGAAFLTLVAPSPWMADERQRAAELLAETRAAEEHTRDAAIAALTKMGREAVPALTAALESEYWRVRANAALGLGRQEREARSAVPALIARVGDENEYVRVNAIFALNAIGLPDVEKAMSTLVEALKDDVSTVRGNAAMCLGGMGKRAQAALPALEAARDDPDERVRQEVALAIGRIRKEHSR